MLNVVTLWCALVVLAAMMVVLNVLYDRMVYWRRLVRYGDQCQAFRERHFISLTYRDAETARICAESTLQLIERANGSPSAIRRCQALVKILNLEIREHERRELARAKAESAG